MNTTPIEPKTERGCSCRQLFRHYCGSSGRRDKHRSSAVKIPARARSRVSGGQEPKYRVNVSQRKYIKMAKTSLETWKNHARFTAYRIYKIAPTKPPCYAGYMKATHTSLRGGSTTEFFCWMEGSDLCSPSAYSLSFPVILVKIVRTVMVTSIFGRSVSLPDPYAEPQFLKCHKKRRRNGN